MTRHLRWSSLRAPLCRAVCGASIGEISLSDDQSRRSAGPLPVRDEFVYFLALSLNGIRRAVETLVRIRASRADGAMTDNAVQAVLEIERTAVPLRFADRSRPGEARQQALQRALANFREMRESPVLRLYLNAKIPRMAPATRERETLSVEGKTVSEALAYLIERTESELGFARGEQTNLSVRDLRSIVPAQKVAPVQFEIRAGRLAILHTPRKGLPEDAANIANAKQTLLDQGNRILSELERSNCDKRLLESVQLLQRQLEDDGNAIQLGLSNVACEVMVRQFQAELPDAVFAMVKAHTRGVEMFAAQFPEWEKFVENAAATALIESDVDFVAKAAAQVVETLEKSPALAEPEVPKTILRLRELLAAPGASGRRAGFAMLRTLENLISRIYAHCVDFADQTAANTVKQLSMTAATVVVASLLAIALNAAGTISPVAVKVPEMQWLRSATEVLKRELDGIGH